MRTSEPLHSIAERHPNVGRRRQGLAAAVLLASAALVLSACTATSPDPGAPASTTLKVGIASLSDGDATDPAKASTAGGYVLARQVFDTLTEYGTDGSWQPQLAESVKAGKDAADWTVTLHKATWSDGTPVTAADVVATVKRWFDDKLPPAGSMPFIDPGKVTVVDDQTVHFQLKYPTVTFPEALTSPTASIVPQGFDPGKPIGSGPFVLTSNHPGVQLTFTANEKYFRGAPGVDKLDVVSFADATSEANALTAGQIDVASDLDPTLVDVVKASTTDKVYNYPTSGTLTWVMNTQKKPFTDPAVMKALRLAVDRQAIVDQVYNGYAKLGNDYFSPFDPLYDHDLPQRAYDPAQAKSILTQAGYALPVPVELWGTDNTPTSKRQNEALVTQAAAAGFAVTFKNVDSATFYGDAYGTYPLSLSYWGFLGIFDQAGFTITKTAPYNSSHWIDPEYDKLYNEALQTVDESARRGLVAQMQTIEYERGAYVVPVFLDRIIGVSTKVKGMQSYPNSDGPFGYNFRILSLG